MTLGRETVLRGALSAIDDGGVEALSMRGLAGRLGVTPMALYNHVRDRRDLLDGVADVLARDIERPPPRWGWRRRLTAILTSTRAVCLAHPRAAALLRDAGALTPTLLAPAEGGLQALGDAGLGPAQARTAWAALIGLTFGHVAYQLAGHMGGPAGGRGAFDPAAFPRIAELAAAPPMDWDAAFARALDALLDGYLRA